MLSTSWTSSTLGESLICTSVALRANILSAHSLWLGIPSWSLRRSRTSRTRYIHPPPTRIPCTRRVHPRAQVKHIWPARWSVVKLLYLINRYGSLVFLGAFTLQNLGVWRSTAHAVRRLSLCLSDTHQTSSGSSATTRQSLCRSSSSCHMHRCTVCHLRVQFTASLSA